MCELNMNRLYSKTMYEINICSLLLFKYTFFLKMCDYFALIFYNSYTRLQLKKNKNQNNCLQIWNQSSPKIVHKESSGKSGVILFHFTGQIGSHYSTMVPANNGMFFILPQRLHSQTFTAIESWNLFPIWHSAISAIFLILMKVLWYMYTLQTAE